MIPKLKTILTGILSLLVLAGIFPVSAQVQSLEQKFENPPYDASPWVFWYWLHGAVTQEGVKADLEAMKQIGLGGAYLMPVKAVPEVPFVEPTAEPLSQQWWNIMKYAVQKSDTLGLKLGVHICDGFALAGGPWITPELSMQKVVWADTVVAGGRKGQRLVLPVPDAYEGYYKDIAVYAYPVVDEASEYSTGNVRPVITSNAEGGDPQRLIRKGNTRKLASKEPCWVLYDFGKPFTCRSIEIVQAPYNYQAFRWQVSASDDGLNFHPVARLESPRFGWQNNEAPNTFVIPSTTARYFRLDWSREGTEVGSEDLDAAKWGPNLGVQEIHLSGEPRILHFEPKSAAVWRIARRTTTEEVGDEFCLKKNDVIDLTSSLSNGMVDLSSLPAGRWKVLRMGHTSTGHTNATGGSAAGLECDKFNPKAVKFQFDSWFGEIYNRVGRDVAKRVIEVMHIDSWECGSQNWSGNFASEFKKRRGYDLMPYLPLYAGIPMESVAESEKVLLDIRETAAELVVDVFYQTMAECAEAYNCRFSAECVSPTMTSDGMMHYQKVDLPMGEFWLRSPTHDKLNDMLDAIHGAHIYGKNIVQAEGFTQLRTMWDEHPGMVKTMADRNFALGINKLVYHVYVHNPWMDRKPGMTLDGIGLYFQRDQTWWDMGRAWVDYAKRCQALLQSGRPVADVAVFTGEDIPRRAVLPDRLVNSLPGIFGAERVENERIRLANEGQPQRTMPKGVKHSAGMADPENWIDPLNGYTYDSFNKDVLLKSKAENGRMVLPSGAAYAVVILPLADRMTPNEYMSEAVATKIAELRAAGVTVLSKGNGLPFTEADFGRYGLEPEVRVVENGVKAPDIAWTHRLDGDTDIYFISNQADRKRDLKLSLRGTGKTVQQWNPVSGERFDIDAVSKDGRMESKIRLDNNESAFLLIGNKLPKAYKAPVYAVNETVEIPEWSVQFDGLQPKVWKTLQDWSKSGEDPVTYYSGTAVYLAQFDWQGKADGRRYLDLGKVGVMAEVFVNGHSCGIVWTPPYRVDVTPYLKKGKNDLRIDVVNTWANRMVGVKNGKVSAEGIWTNAPYRLDGEPLCESGLLGPLKLVTEK